MSHKYDKTYWEKLNDYFRELDKLKVQNEEWKCWENVKTEKLRIVESVIQTEIHESKESCSFLIKRIKVIVHNYGEVEKVIRQYRWEEVDISFRRKLVLLFLKWHLYGILVFVKRFYSKL